MYVCRLFHRDRPFEQMEARVLAEGRVTLGRDPSADWPVADPDGVLSRLHCTLSVEADRLWLTDLSTNGTFLGDGSRVEAGQAVELQPRQTVKLGALTLLVDEMQEVAAAPSATTISRSPAAACSPASRAGGGTAGVSLLEAFCEGAGLDASAFSAQEPAELMRRAGGVYRETVAGLAALMTERARFKEEQGLDRTTIRAADNNPFKWASARTVAHDLLLQESPNFLHDEGAVRASFQDLAEHLTAVTESARAAAALAVEALAPESIAAEAREAGGLLKSHAAACWEVHNRRHARLKAEGGAPDGAVRRAITGAYARAKSAAAG